jgi:gingipain R
MCGQDEMNDILTEAHINNIKRTFAGIGMNGCMQMNDEYGSAGDEMTDTWTCFGDPSFVVRTQAPHVMNVTHVQTELIGLSQLSVFCNEEGALVSLLLDGEIIGTGTVIAGVAVISFNPILSLENIEVAVTSFNTVPYFGMVEVTALMNVQDNNLIGLKLFPNPTKAQLNINFALQNNSEAKVEIQNLAGQLLVIRPLGHLNSGIQNHQIDLSSFSSGVYFLSVSTSTGISKQRFVVE